ncbi:alpha-D-ribose 1-methylphosphonate 5-triphosphate diphosphatase [Sulfitobacter delicatus]|uniref:Alpha-D-ribose 1-methylphosphonate 5-triphosphate diphosphatase n=1 Tax=Sulfitobacter delicatus TaxID=218672 RepID=A0A1G7MQH7_9RHOB|nr:alpha-D-ribose 1-methylphosphonate 5-triphosphate diphosphatase [Sulfitobacter delicatus]SDF64035.1 alpha-D-ribose 1-methylphosphonate 5-triphosphate diphosphatase [Sulfitobacter delicatus]
MPNLDLIGAEVLHPEGLSNAPLSFAEGMVSAEPVGRTVDLTGFQVLPGIVDLHGDGFERHLAPRRGAMKQLAEGLVAAEAELAANGITTAVLAQFVSWEGGLRGLDFADQVFSGIRDTAPNLVTDVRPQLRFETHMLDLYASLPQRIADWGVGYVVFNDHLPHDRIAAGKTPKRLVGQALKAGRSPESHLAQMQEMHGRRNEVPAALDALCAELSQCGVRMGSHDDQTAETRAAWRARGVTLAEFPETQEAAEAAHAAGDAVIMGAPNVVRGGSHNGNLSALDLISMGLCHALASDYHYPSPRRAALILARSGLVDLAGAWALVSSGPAQVLGLTDRGTLAPGKRADIVVLDQATGRVAATFAAGRVSYMSGAVAERFTA